MAAPADFQTSSKFSFSIFEVPGQLGLSVTRGGTAHIQYKVKSSPSPFSPPVWPLMLTLWAAEVPACQLGRAKFQCQCRRFPGRTPHRAEQGPCLLCALFDQSHCPSVASPQAWVQVAQRQSRADLPGSCGLVFTCALAVSPGRGGLCCSGTCCVRAANCFSKSCVCARPVVWLNPFGTSPEPALPTAVLVPPEDFSPSPTQPVSPWFQQKSQSPCVGAMLETRLFQNAVKPADFAVKTQIGSCAAFLPRKATALPPCWAVKC